MMDKMVALSARETRLEERKNQAVEALSAQFSRNAMPLEEYERLVDYIGRVESERELVLVEKLVDESALYAGENAQMPRSPQAELVRDSHNSSGVELALFANREISGETLNITGGNSVGPHKIRSFLSLFGNLVITIQDGDLPPGRTVVETTAVFGNVVIRVAPSVSVVVEATAIAGNTTVLRGVERQRSANGPELVVKGGAYLGNIVVEVLKKRK